MIEDASEAAVEAIASGLKSDAWSLRRPKMIGLRPTKRNDRGWPTHFVAALISGPDFDGHIGLWAVGIGDYVGPIIALNDLAKEYSSWGEAAQPNSKMDNVRRHLASYSEADRLVAAVASG